MPFFSSRPTAVFNIRGAGLKPYLFRQIVTKGYVAAGYKDSVPWRNVCALNMATDTSTNLGDILTETCNYLSGSQNKDIAFMFGTGGVGAFTATSVFNMRNDTTYARTGAMTLGMTVGESATIQASNANGVGTIAYINGNNASANILKFNLTTEAYMNASQGTSMSQTTIGASAHYEDKVGYWWNDTPQNFKYTFATETETALTNNTVGWHSQQKGVNSKLGKGYAGNEGIYNSGFNLRKWNYTTETIQAIYPKPVADSGEENYVTGQDHHWMLGMYGAPGPSQNNRSWKWTFATETGFEGSASMQPSAPGIAGRSSGYGFWRD